MHKADWVTNQSLFRAPITRFLWREALCIHMFTCFKKVWNAFCKVHCLYENQPFYMGLSESWRILNLEESLLLFQSSCLTQWMGNLSSHVGTHNPTQSSHSVWGTATLSSHSCCHDHWPSRLLETRLVLFDTFSRPEASALFLNNMWERPSAFFL